LVEREPGSQNFERLPNPVDSSRLVSEIQNLRTPDTHSVSLTGGEPLSAGRFLVDVARRCKRAGFQTYLETSGNNSRAMERVARYLDYAAVDLKLPSHRAVPAGRWSELLREELLSVRAAASRGASVFVKIVVLRSTRAEEVEEACRRLEAVARVPVVLQPASPVGRDVEPPAPAQLLRFSETVGRLGLEVRTIPQLHRIIGVR
jgi:organic radical activating enzyme